MVDSIVFQFEKKSIDRILNQLEISPTKSHKEYVEGKWHNFTIKIDITPTGFLVAVMGSLNKYFLNGTNSLNYNILDVQKAIDKLVIELDVNPSECEVFRVDIGSNIITKQKPDNYNVLLDFVKGYKKSTILDCETVYFERSKRKKVLAFYNKFKESRRSDNDIPATLVTRNLYRYEIRFKKLEEVLEVPKFTLVELRNTRFLKQLIRIWEGEYLSIVKLELPKFNDEPQISKIKDFLIQLGIHNLGGWLKLEKLLEPHFNEHPHIRKDRVRASIRNSLETIRFGKSELINELNAKVIFRGDISSFERLL